MSKMFRKVLLLTPLSLFIFSSGVFAEPVSLQMAEDVACTRLRANNECERLAALKSRKAFDNRSISTPIRWLLPSLYVDPSGSCNGNSPCYTTIQSAIDTPNSGSVIKIMAGTYAENLDVNSSYNYELQGGWDSTYSSQTSTSSVSSMTFGSSSGTVTVGYITIGKGGGSGDGIVNGTAYFPIYPTYAECDQWMRRCQQDCATKPGCRECTPWEKGACLRECYEKYPPNPWDWQPEYYEDVNDVISVYLYDSNGTIISKAITREDGNFEFTELVDGFYYLTAYSQMQNERDDEQVDVFESETDLFAVGSTTVRDVYLEYVETVTPKNGSVKTKYVPSGCEEHGGYLVWLRAASPNRSAVCKVYVDGKIKDEGNPAGYGGFVYDVDKIYPPGTELRLEVTGGELMTPGSSISVWCPGDQAFDLWP